jgi:AcrR family transcriptional regulator
MTEIQLHETKDKILHTARFIFSAKGFEGASIRQIASEAGVNIAAVNYHFTSKEKLFKQVFDLVFRETSQNIRTRRLENPNEKVDDLAVWIFRYFLEKADILRSVFQMMLSEKGWGPENQCVDNGWHVYPQLIQPCNVDSYNYIVIISKEKEELGGLI